MPRRNFSNGEWDDFIHNESGFFIEAESRKLAKQRVEEEKQILIEKVTNDPITEEIAAGPLSDNISNTLDGYGNLHSFLGFETNSTPISNLIDFLQERIKLSPSRGRRVKRGRGSAYVYKVETLSEEDFNSPEFLTPWGISWVLGIVNGIGNFVHYLFKRNKNFATSRSGPAIQVDGRIDRKISSSRPRRYIFKHLLRFANRLQK